MSENQNGFFEALNYQNGFRDGKNGNAKAFFSRLQTGSQREAYDEGYEDRLRQREADGHTKISIDE